MRAASAAAMPASDPASSRSSVSTSTSQGLAMAAKRPANVSRSRAMVGTGAASRRIEITISECERITRQQRSDPDQREQVQLALNADGVGRVPVSPLANELGPHAELPGLPGNPETIRRSHGRRAERSQALVAARERWHRPALDESEAEEIGGRLPVPA